MNGTVHSPPPSIIAKFVKRNTNEKFYKASSKTTRYLVGLTSAEGNSIYIAESLTQAIRRLFKAAIKVKKSLNFNFKSTTNGRIFFKQEQMQSPLSKYLRDRFRAAESIT